VSVQVYFRYYRLSLQKYPGTLQIFKPFCWQVYNCISDITAFRNTPAVQPCVNAQVVPTAWKPFYSLIPGQTKFLAMCECTDSSNSLYTIPFKHFWLDKISNSGWNHLQFNAVGHGNHSLINTAWLPAAFSHGIYSADPCCMIHYSFLSPEGYCPLTHTIRNNVTPSTDLWPMARNHYLQTPGSPYVMGHCQPPGFHVLWHIGTIYCEHPQFFTQAQKLAWNANATCTIFSARWLVCAMANPILLQPYSPSLRKL